MAVTEDAQRVHGLMDLRLAGRLLASVVESRPGTLSA